MIADELSKRGLRSQCGIWNLSITVGSVTHQIRHFSMPGIQEIHECPGMYHVPDFFSSISCSGITVNFISRTLVLIFGFNLHVCQVLCFLYMQSCCQVICIFCIYSHVFHLFYGRGKNYIYPLSYYHVTEL